MSHRDLHPEVFRELPNRAGILQKLAADEDYVRLPAVKHALRNPAILDASYGGDEDPVSHGCFDLGREVCLERVSLAQRRELLFGVVPGGRHVDEVDAVL